MAVNSPVNLQQVHSRISKVCYFGGKILFYVFSKGEKFNVTNKADSEREKFLAKEWIATMKL